MNQPKQLVDAELHGHHVIVGRLIETFGVVGEDSRRARERRLDQRPHEPVVL